MPNLTKIMENELKKRINTILKLSNPKEILLALRSLLKEAKEGEGYWTIDSEMAVNIINQYILEVYLLIEDENRILEEELKKVEEELKKVEEFNYRIKDKLKKVQSENKIISDKLKKQENLNKPIRRMRM